MKFQNIKLETMLVRLKPLLQKRDKVGYIAARNYRKINNALSDYFIFKGDLLGKYGTKNEDGTISITPDSENFTEFVKEFEPIASIEQTIDIMTMPYNEVIGILNGEEILNVDWMLTETE